MSNGVPKFLRLKNLEELGIAKSHQAVRHMQMHYGFPLGRLLGPGTRVWTEDEINEWLASRPVEPSEQARGRSGRRRFGGKSGATRRQRHWTVGSNSPMLLASDLNSCARLFPVSADWQSWLMLAIPKLCWNCG